MPRKRIRRLKAGYKVGGPTGSGTTRRGSTRGTGPTGGGSRSGGFTSSVPGLKPIGGTTKRQSIEDGLSDAVPISPKGSAGPRTGPSAIVRGGGPTGSGSGSRGATAPKRKAEPGRKSPMAGPRRVLSPGIKRRIKKS